MARTVAALLATILINHLVLLAVASADHGFASPVFSPASFDFGEVAIGDIRQAAFSIDSNNDGFLAITDISGAPPFYVTGIDFNDGLPVTRWNFAADGPILLNVGTHPPSIRVWIVFAPSAALTYTEPIRVTWCDRSCPEPMKRVRTFNVTGSGRPPVRLSIGDAPPVTEGRTGTVDAAFTVSLSAPSSQPVTTAYATRSGTAVEGADCAAGIDYVRGNGTLTFSPGQTSRGVTVGICGDGLDEPDEIFSVVLTGASGAPIADGQGTGTIVDDDPLPELSVGDARVTEPATGRVGAPFTVSLSAPSGHAATVAYAVDGGTATGGSSCGPGVDYVRMSGTLTFGPGETSKVVAVEVCADPLEEPDETFLVSLSAPTNATLRRAQGRGTIADRGSLLEGRAQHAGTALADGRVLVVGGLGSGGAPLATAELYDPPTGAWGAAGTLRTASANHTATLLPDGRVLVAGGEGAAGPLRRYELFDPAGPPAEAWTLGGSLAEARYWHSATRLADGRVLIAGGKGVAGPLATAEIYDPAADTWRPAGAMAGARYGHAATLLPSGKVLVAGGLAGGDQVLATAELYDPATGAWTSAGAMGQGRFAATATLLPSGKVLLTAGYNDRPTVLASAELFEPATGVWTPTGSLTQSRYWHAATALPGGRVLVTGGGVGGVEQAGAELYDPAAGAWIGVGAMVEARANHTAALLPDGRVLVAAGWCCGSTGLLASAELYDPVVGSWSGTGGLAEGRAQHQSTALADGRILVVGGLGAGGARLATAELYDPAVRTWTMAGTLRTASANHTATRLPDGRILVTGGEGAAGPLRRAELYDPARPPAEAWTQTGSLAEGRYWHSATRLADGRVLAAGGMGAGGPLSSAELYGPDGGWPATGRLLQARYGHIAVLLPSGKVLVAGGSDGGESALTSAELYDPATGVWSATGAMAQGRFAATATLLPSGKVLVAAGYNDRPTVLASAELFEPATGVWTPTGSLTQSRYWHAATALPGGRVLVTGGGVGGVERTSAELYDPAAGAWIGAGAMVEARANHTAALLPDGRVLVAAGWCCGGTGPLASAELYDPTASSWARP